jgi:hypothetical protein
VTPSKLDLLEDGGSKPPAVQPSSVSRKGNRTSSTRRSTSSKRLTSKPKSSPMQVAKQKEMPVIDPTFAMIARELYKGQKNVLAIGQDAGTWDFDLKTHLSTIQGEYRGHDFYLVGYRNEERPPIKSIHKTIQIHVPFFVVHALPKSAAQPSCVKVSDLELMTLESHEMATLPLKWTKLFTFPSTGQEVKMLVSTARATSCAMASQTNDVCSGAQFWFAVPVDWHENPGDAFVFYLEGDQFFFFEDPWIETKVELTTALELDGVEWADFCRWEEQRWLDLLLKVAVDKFFAYEDDLPREECESEVTKLLAEAFRSFKEKREVEESLYEMHRAVAENSKHFKIYPENECLKSYLSGDCLKISKWCGNAEAVYPHVSPPSVNTLQRDLWGNPLF